VRCFMDVSYEEVIHKHKDEQGARDLAGAIAEPLLKITVSQDKSRERTQVLARPSFAIWDKMFYLYYESYKTSATALCAP
jgi:hypothetical protein